MGGDVMRLRNVKNKQEIMEHSSHLVGDPFFYKGRWHELFGNHHPIYLEIGMGKGQFLIEQAKRNPSINYLGIEKFDSVVARALQKIPEDLPNLMVIRANARDIEEMFFHEISLLYLNFSDPWPKKRHQLRRLTSCVFLEKYDSIFVGEKRIIQRTDNQGLFEYSLISFSQNGYILEEVSLDLHQSDSFDGVMTEFEEKFTEAGFPIYRVVAVKKGVN